MNDVSYFISPVIDFDIITVDINLLIGVVVNSSWVWIPGIACKEILLLQSNDYKWVWIRKYYQRLTGHVICNHEDDLAVWNAQSLDAPVDWKDIGHMPIVEPESWRVYQNSPITWMIPWCKKFFRFFILCKKKLVLHNLTLLKRTTVINVESYQSQRFLNRKTD